MRNHTRWARAILGSCLLAGASHLPPAFAQTSELAKPPATSEPAPLTPEELYAQAYRFANQGDFATAITRMLEIPPEAANYTQAQAKIREWKGILLARGSSYEKELARNEFEQAYFWANKGYFVRAVYEMAQIKAGTPFYSEAQQKINLWKKLIVSSGSSFEREMERFQTQFANAERLAANGNFEMALLAADRIQEESPFYPQARHKLASWQHTLDSSHKPSPTPLPEISASPTPVPETVASTLPKPPFIDIGLQNRYGLSLGKALMPAPALGLGLSWYPLPAFGLHAEGNLFYSENYLAWFVPFTLRWAPLSTANWRVYLGVGGFGQFVEDRAAFGGLAELGADWWVLPNLGLGLSLDYGLAFSPQLDHSLGLSLQLKFGIN